MKKKKIVFKASKGAMFNDEQAQVYGEFLFGKAMENTETITTHEVLEAARSKKSPIHDYFDWEDSIAAEKHRLWQARQLLSSIQIVVVYQNQEKVVKAFHNIYLEEDSLKEERRTYVTVQGVAQNEYFRSQVLANALKEIKAWQSRYSEYKELGLIFGAIEEIQKQLDLKGKQIEARV